MLLPPPGHMPTSNHPYFYITLEVFAKKIKSRVAYFSTRRKNPTLSQLVGSNSRSDKLQETILCQNTLREVALQHQVHPSFMVGHIWGPEGWVSWQQDVAMWQDWIMLYSRLITTGSLIVHDSSSYFYFSKWPWPGFDRARAQGGRCISRRHVYFHI